MKEIKIKADLWNIAPKWAVAGTRGSFGSCKLTFDLSPNWEGLGKRITFFPAGEEEGVAILISGSSVTVPDEVMARAGTAIFVLDGISPEGKRLVSTRGELRVIDTALPGGKEPKHFVPSEIDQLRMELERLRGEVERLKKGAA